MSDGFCFDFTGFFGGGKIAPQAPLLARRATSTGEGGLHLRLPTLQVTSLFRVEEVSTQPDDFDLNVLANTHLFDVPMIGKDMCVDVGGKGNHIAFFVMNLIWNILGWF